MNFLKSLDNTYIVMFFVGLYELLDVFRVDSTTFSSDFWITFAIVLKGIGGLTLMVGTVLLELNNRKLLTKEEKHKKKKFYFWVIVLGLIVVFVGVILKIKSS